MIAISEILNRAALPWWEALARASWQGGLALAVVWGLVRLRPRLSPRIQCWLWRLAYLKLLVAFFWGTPLALALLAPPPPVAAPWATTAPSTVVPPEFRTYMPSSQNFGDYKMVPAPNSGSLLTTGGMLLALWLGMIVWQMGRAITQWHSVLRIFQACRPIQESELFVACTLFTQRLGLRRAPRLLAWDEATSPLLLGIRNPAIVLPEAMAASYVPIDQELMLAHELAHLRRRDLLWAWLPLLARTLFAFHPLIWFAQWELITAQEMDCDVIALETTRAPVTGYANLLIRIASQSGAHSRSELAGVGMAASFHSLKRRLFAIKAITPLSPARLALSVFSLLLLGLIGIVPWRVTAQTRNVVPTAPLQTTTPTVEKPGAGLSADAKVLKARAGNYTILLEKTALVNSGGLSGAKTIMSQGVSFKPNLAISLKVLGRPSDRPLLAGLSPQVAAVDANGMLAELPPATFPARLWNTAQESGDVLYLRLPNPGVGHLRSLEGSLLIYDGKVNRLDVPVKDLQFGFTKQFGAMTFQAVSIHVNTGGAGISTIEADLVLTQPKPSIDPALLTQNPYLLPEIILENARSLSAELRDIKGHVYKPITLSFTLVPADKLATLDNRTAPKGNDGATRQAIHLTFQMPDAANSPKTLTLLVASRNGKTQTLPFRFTQVLLPSPQ